MPTFDFRLVSALALNRMYASNGQRYTTLVKRWAEAYLPLHGAKPSEISINGVTFRADGGVDGLIQAPLLKDPLSIVMPNSVFQFKAGKTEASKAKAELLEEPKEGGIRIRDYLEQGYRLVWFVGHDMTDPELDAFRSTLRDAVQTLPNAHPDPFVVDNNRLADMLNRTPALALETIGGVASGQTIRSALEGDRRFQNPFVPSATFEAYRADLEKFVFSGEDGEDVRFLAGAPGLGKTRTVLEAFKANQGLSDSTLYFNDPREARDFLNVVQREGLRVVVIVDEYLGGSDSGVSFGLFTLPRGCRAVVIGNAFKTDQREPQYRKDVRPLTTEELTSVVSAVYSSATKEATAQLVSYCKPNVRVTLLLARAALRDDDFDLSPGHLQNFITAEIQKDAEGQEAMMRLSLLRYLPAEQIESFCGLTEMDPRRFREACEASANRSEYVTNLRNVVHMSAPVLSDTALFYFWRMRQSDVERILVNAGTFADAMLQRINELPQEPEKAAMISFFEPPTGGLTLQTIQQRGVGDRLLLMATASPDRYLPILRALFTRERGSLDQFPYEGAEVERRDVIWRLRDLAQFAEHFEACEEIVYGLAREEIQSAYGNVASTYWPSWFHAWFDHTEYPYDRRLDLLQRRIREGDERDRELAISALAFPFPEVGTNVPSDVVGGRLAPLSLQRLNEDQYRMAATRIPELLIELLECGSASIRTHVSNAIVQARFQWLSVLADPSPLAKVLKHPLFDPEAKRRMVVEVRQYLALFDNERKREPQVEQNRIHYERFLPMIDENDPLVDAELILKSGGMDIDDSPSLAETEQRIVERAANDDAFLQSLMPLLLDAKSFGSARFGKKLATLKDESFMWDVLHGSLTMGIGSYLLGVVGAAVERRPALADEVEAILVTVEQARPAWSQAIRQVLGGSYLVKGAVRLLRNRIIPLRGFQGVWSLHREEDLAVVSDFLALLAERVAERDDDAVQIAITVADIARRGLFPNHEVRPMALLAFLALIDKGEGGKPYEWEKVGEWLLDYDPGAVITALSNDRQSQFSESTQLLAHAAPKHATLVLDALRAKLLAPYEPPYLFFGSLDSVLWNTPVDEFGAWLDRHGIEEAFALAGHLPKPHLDEEGRGVVPELTAAFWERHPVGSERFDDLLANFRSHNYNTGVFMGHGIDLFTQRVELAHKLQTHPLDAIRHWAEGFERDSKASLVDAERRMEIDNAARETER